MREYAIVKQSPGFLDMFAFYFGVSIDDIDTINQIFPEWVEGYYYGSSLEAYVNSPSTYSDMKSTVYHNTDYDILIVGTSRCENLPSANSISGLRASDSTGNLTYNTVLAYAKTLYSYTMFNDVKNMYLYCSQDKAVELPIIGIKLKSGITPLINPAPDPDRGDDMRSDEIPEPDPDDVKDEPADPDPEPEPEPETRSTRKK